MNFLLHRTKGYNPNGRMQTEEEAQALDDRIKGLLERNGVEYTDFIATKENVETELVPQVLKAINWQQENK